MNATTNARIAELFSGAPASSADRNGAQVAAQVVARGARKRLSFSYLFFSDVRKDVSDRDKYKFARELVEFADQSGFEAVYFPERHFSEFGSIYANNAVMAGYFAPLTRNIRLRTAAVTVTTHHPAEIVESWAMVDILSDGRVDLGFGNGWNKADFIVSPDTYEDRVALRNARIPLIQKLWRGEAVSFAGPGGESLAVTVYPRPVQPELNVWYVTTSESGFQHAGTQGYNVFTMLSGTDLKELGKNVACYRQARAQAGLDPDSGTVTLMMHTFVHPDREWVEKSVASPFKSYIRSTVAPHMKAVGKQLDREEIDRMVDYSYARYFQTGGIFGSVEDCQLQLEKAADAGVNEIAFLQDFGVDYSAVRASLGHLKDLVDRNLS